LSGAIHLSEAGAGKVLSRLKGAVRRVLYGRASGGHVLPGNLQPRTITQAEIANQVEFAISCGAGYRERIEGMRIPIHGARVLEIGPGIAFGPMAYLRAAGAAAAVTDRWLAPWTDAFHGPIYAALADQLEGEPGFDATPLRRMVAERGYGDGSVLCLHDAAENLASIPDNHYDAIVSNAVLEHINVPDKAFAELHRVTRPGGVGCHQVDFRDHRDFSRPLEHLLLSPAEFLKINEARSFEFGSQLRQPDYAALLQQAGFVIEQFYSNETASDAYLDDIISRLPASRHPMRATWTREVLSHLGGDFRLRKQAG
jgi:SAM-dependent methyltransferase